MLYYSLLQLEVRQAYSLEINHNKSSDLNLIYIPWSCFRHHLETYDKNR